MKKVVYLFALFLPVSLSAQNIKLKKGQQFTINSSIKQEMDMGMGGDMKNDITAVALLNVNESTKAGYEVSSKLSRIIMNIDGMGQQQNFDSDKPEDMNGEAGKMLGGNIGKERKVTLDNTTGKATTLEPVSNDKKEEENENPLAAMLGNAGSEDPAAMVESLFYILPAGKKIGDSWSDSSEVKNDSKEYKTYTLKAINADIATLGYFSKSTNIVSQEIQGMQIDINTSTVTEGEILLNTKTSLIQKMNTVADVTGTMEMMGQSMPINSKVTSVIEIK